MSSGTTGTRGTSGAGNASLAPEKREGGHNYFTFRVNASKINAEELKEILAQRCVRYAFQLERGEKSTEKNPEGYLHYQGYFHHATRARFSTLQKIFPPGTELQIAKSQVGAWEYCTKEETREEGPWTKGDPPKMPVRRAKKQPKEEVEEEKEELDLIVPDRPWQVKILDMLNEKPDDRSIYWYWEPNGGFGKTQFCKYVVAKLGALYVDGCKKSDILYAASEKKCNIILIDIMKDDDIVPYQAMEAVKNGIFFSPKYESKTVVRNSPHVIVFSNREPDTTRLSKDRWHVKRLAEEIQ